MNDNNLVHAAYTLVPQGDGKEALKIINITTGEEFFLGRNESTIILNTQVENFLFVSRNQAKISVKNNGCLYLTPTSRTPGLVYVNGVACQHNVEIEVFVDQTISLLGQANYFNFRIMKNKEDELPESPDKISTGKRKNDESPIDCTVVHDITHIKKCKTANEPIKIIENNNIVSSAAVESNGSISKLSSILECPICFQAMALAHTSAPCGHTFCYICITDWKNKSKECPTCKGEVVMITPSLLIDSTIREILAKNTDELQEWETRSAAALELKKSCKSDPSSNKISCASVPTIDLNSPSSSHARFRGGVTSSRITMPSSIEPASRNVTIVSSTSSLVTAKKNPNIRQFFDLTKD